MAEIKATFALSDLNRRECLLKIIRGKPTLKFYVFWGCWFLLFVGACISCTEKHYNPNVALLLAVLVLFVTIKIYADISRRMNALIELIGEDNLRKLKTDDKEQNAYKPDVTPKL